MPPLSIFNFDNMQRTQKLIWLAKLVGGAAAGLVFLGCISSLIASGPEIQATEIDGEAAPTLIAYRNERTPTSVLIGTSMTYLLKEQYFLPMQIRNLAIPGRSILTGLQVVASYPKLPDNIFVETNVMIWNADGEFVQKFSYNSSPILQIEPPVRSLVSYINSVPKAGVRFLPADETILQRPPAEYDNQIHIERGKKQWSGHNHDETILSNVASLARIVEKIESRGSKIYFFELPMASGMAETDMSKATKAAFEQRFPESSRRLALSYQMDELRFRDHAHLDERSAMIVSHALRDAIHRK